MAEKPDSRIPLRVSYEHAPEGKRESAPGSDLSLGGVFIETAATFPVGALLSLEIESGTTKVAVDARILSRRAAGPDRPAGLAVSFIDLPNDVAASLHFILEARTPRKGTMLGLGEAEDEIPTYQSERRLPAAGSRPEVEAAPAPLARPATPVMETKTAQAPSHVTSPATPPLSHPPPPAAPASFPLARPSAPPSWAPPPGPHAAPPWPAAVPATRRGRGMAVALAIAGVILLLVAVAAAAWVFRGKLG